jgi:hypothetical protein
MDEWHRFSTDKAISFAIEAIKGAMLLNGGAAIALMTLVGAVTAKGSDAVGRLAGARPSERARHMGLT